MELVCWVIYAVNFAVVLIALLTLYNARDESAVEDDSPSSEDETTDAIEPVNHKADRRCSRYLDFPKHCRMIIRQNSLHQERT